MIKGGKKTVHLNYGFSNKRVKVSFVEWRNMIFLTLGGSRYELTLDQFNAEWYELQRKGKLDEEDVGVVPDIYLRNEELDAQVKSLRTEGIYYYNAKSLS